MDALTLDLDVQLCRSKGSFHKSGHSDIQLRRNASRFHGQGLVGLVRGWSSGGLGQPGFSLSQRCVLEDCTGSAIVEGYRALTEPSRFSNVSSSPGFASTVLRSSPNSTYTEDRRSHTAEGARECVIFQEVKRWFLLSFDARVLRLAPSSLAPWRSWLNPTYLLGARERE